MLKTSKLLSASRKQAKNIVCPECEGEGKLLNEAFRGQVLEPEFASDPEFMEEMNEGMYDVTCPRCHGRCVVKEEEQQTWDDNQEWRDEIRREERMLGNRDF